MDVPEEARLTAALVLLERERMGLVTQAPGADVTESLLRTPGTEAELRVGSPSEDLRQREVLALLLRGEPVTGLEGSFVLLVGPSGAAPAVVRGPRAIRDNEGLVVELEVRSGGEVEGWWAYSRRPRFREVSLTGVDDGDPVHAEVFHAATLRAAAGTPSSVALDGGWRRLRFELTGALLEQAVPIDACEQVLEALDRRAGGGDLRWPESAVDPAALEEAGAEVETALPPGRRVDLTLRAGDREITRGKRLQPRASYPVTLVREDGSPMAAMLGCSISGS
jgi:hypothetical protein